MALRLIRRLLRRIVRGDKKEEARRRVKSSLPYFLSIKNRYAGRRGFVVGNGPSLRISDLDRLQSEITIASNKIFLAFDQTKWRPTYFTIADPLVWPKVSAVVGRHFSSVAIPHYLPARRDCSVAIKTFRHLGNAPDLSRSRDEVFFSPDLTVGSYGGNTVTYDNLQMAVHLGLNPIYIIGCDHYYRGEGSVKADQSILVSDNTNHFLPNYREKGEIVNPAPIEQMNISYEMARRYSINSGIQIFNATRGGFLEIFPRIDLDDLLR